MWSSVCDPNSPEFGSSTSSRNIGDVMLARNSSFCEVSGFSSFCIHSSSCTFLWTTNGLCFFLWNSDFRSRAKEVA